MADQRGRGVQRNQGPDRVTQRAKRLPNAQDGNDVEKLHGVCTPRVDEGLASTEDSAGTCPCRTAMY